MKNLIVSLLMIVSFGIPINAQEIETVSPEFIKEMEALNNGGRSNTVHINTIKNTTGRRTVSSIIKNYLNTFDDITNSFRRSGCYEEVQLMDELRDLIIDYPTADNMSWANDQVEALTDTCY